MSTTTTPKSSPFGEGASFQIEVPRDVKTRAGNVILPAGQYTAWQEDLSLPDAKLGTVTVWADGKHYAGCDWVALTANRYRNL